MTLPVFITHAALVAGQTVSLDGDEGRHAVAVRRLRVGELIELTDGNGTRAVCEVVSLAKHSLVALVNSAQVEAPSELTFTVVQALAKGDRSDLALEILTEVGADIIVPWAAAHSIAKWDDSAKGKTKWQRTVQESMKQSRRSYLPAVTDLHSTAQVCEILASADLAVVLHESADTAFAELELPQAGSVVIVVGPEGGISPLELAAFSQAGAAITQMGRSVMRTSTAGGIALGVLISRTKRWAIRNGQ